MLIDPWKRLDQSRLGIRQLEIRLRKELMLLCEDDMPPVELQLNCNGQFTIGLRWRFA
jgi:hypothetical protein